MAVSVTLRPYGVIITGSENNLVTSNASGTLLIYKVSHGLVSDDIVYVKSRVEDYNGFWFVEPANADEFYLKPFQSTGLDYIDYIVDATGTWYQCQRQAHTWSCVHLPIVYKLSNTLWPTNSVDTARTMTVTDSNGYCAISASGDIKTTGSAAALEFVKVTNAGDYDGVYQITSYTNDTTFTINLAYSSEADTALTAGNIQYYYNNYIIYVRIYGGITSGHTWRDQKPYELLATLELLPDETNEVSFSVHEVLKQQINLSNNLLKATLPNNIDAFTMFYIEYGEEYDDSDGTTLSRSTVSYTDDSSNFEGYAVNAILPFKNIHSGALSEYITGDDLSGKFLTNSNEPSLFDGQYFDLSFITNGEAPVFIKQLKYLNNILVSASATAVTDSGPGLYRVQIEDDCGTTDQTLTSVSVEDELTTSGSGQAVGMSSNVTTTIGGESFGPYTGLVVVTLDVTGTNILGADGNGTATVRFKRGGASGTIIHSSIVGTVTGNDTDSVSSTITLESVDYIDIFINASNANGGLSIYNIEADVTYTIYTSISEVKTINFQCGCENQTLYLSWLNNLGGFDYWNFTAEKEYPVEIGDTGETKKNIFNNWSNSYGEFADTIRKQTFRESRKQVLVKSQHLTLEQVEAISYIKSSVLVQIVNSIYDRRTVIVDNQSWTKYKESDKKDTYTIQFLITYTDDIPVQRV